MTGIALIRSEVPMKNDLTELVDGGYCYSHRKSGPFRIGEDFQAPEPSARMIARNSIDRGTSDKLWSFLANAPDIDAETSDAELFDDAIKRTEFENGINQALSWYVSDCQVQTELPRFRKQLQRLRKAIDRFQPNIPDEDSSLGHFLYNTYTGEVFLGDRLKPSERQLLKLQDHWREHVGFPALQDTLKAMLRNIEAAQSMIGKGKPRAYQIRGFVRSLAEVWEGATGKWPTSGRNPLSKKQAGRFADFVRSTNQLLPRRFQIPSLDAAIRSACEAKASRAG